MFRVSDPASAVASPGVGGGCCRRLLGAGVGGDAGEVFPVVGAAAMSRLIMLRASSSLANSDRWVLPSSDSPRRR